MPDGVKDRRPYDSPRRREQAAETRRSILTAARRLFEAKGYTGTSVPAIAEEAGVAVKTVYLSFNTKAALLRAVWDERLSGEEAGTPIKEQAWYRAVIEEPSPERLIRMVAAHSRAVKARSASLMEVIRNAREADSEIASLWNAIEVKLLDVQRSIVKRLAEQGALATADLAHATDILWTLNHPSVWQLLVHHRGWSAQQYESWLGDILCSQLLTVHAQREPSQPRRNTTFPPP